MFMKGVGLKKVSNCNHNLIKRGVNFTIFENAAVGELYAIENAAEEYKIGVDYLERVKFSLDGSS